MAQLEARQQAIDALLKLGAARDTASAVLEGRFLCSPSLLDSLAQLVAASALHARFSEAIAA
jgi:hypothetical protein